MSKKALVVNLFAGPGSGKSTICAHIFAELKWKGISCEMALEYAKDKVWEESYKVFDSQLYIAGKQFHRINRLADKVDVVITDSPLLFSIIYDNTKSDAFAKTILDHFNQFNNLNFFIERKKDYDPNGRFQTAEEAKELDSTILYMLQSNNVNYKHLRGTREGANEIVNLITTELSPKCTRCGEVLTTSWQKATAVCSKDCWQDLYITNRK